ncbi:BON domain-containing protein [Herbaspirillum sp. RTI4]|uniref:BON domain-containing protein n=1 Tax=Herbaspirillum sp. RTI4 TaxID=3048640 RepID=UPI002AB432BF|nr:BON domain-containing protein [Herbaspirillum sp. RTI4]MDY7578947.1 BON domain-containing protein [Herbaspirillum sp. RTI4]MEA9980878.1 BON domain-containing protein [Herbaspirillum sp. RTI4]
MKNDHQLKQDILEELAWEPSVNEDRIGVEVDKGIVTLVGRLDSYAEKYAAERAVQRVSGVKGLAVELDVRLPGSSVRTDADIAKTAQEGLEWNAFVPEDKIRVMVEDGWITLSGEVEHAHQKEAAESTLRRLMGVVGISNQLTVKPVTAPVIAPENVKLKIEAALQRRAHADTKAIQVTVDGSKIILSGIVPNLAERREACRAAARAPGVVQVIDKMTAV